MRKIKTIKIFLEQNIFLLYNDDYIDELLQKYEGILFNSKDELIGLINCNYIDNKDINKRPFSKLTKDILKELE